MMKRIVPTLGTFVLAALLLPSAPVQAQSIVTNGGFDTGDLSGWSTSGPGFVGPIYQQDGTFYGATSAPYAADFNGGNNADPVALYQDLTTVAGTTYRLEFDFGVVGGAPYNLPQSLVVTVLGNPLTSPTTLLAQTVTGAGNAPVAFTRYTYTFTATGSTTRIQFDNDGSNTLGEDALLDTVSVTAVTPISLIAATTSEVTTLLNQGVLSGAQATSLLSTLTGAMAQLADGKTTPARHMLGAFINKVTAHKRSGALSVAQADALIAAANAAINAIP
jgi:hypothetical protein